MVNMRTNIEVPLVQFEVVVLRDIVTAIMLLVFTLHAEAFTATP